MMRNSSITLFFFGIFILVNVSHAMVLDNTCPTACFCKTSSSEVTCNYGYWSELPAIPANTTTLKIRKGKFGVLKTRPACGNYRTLQRLDLSKVEISVVTRDAFICMPELLQLRMTHNGLVHIGPGAFDTLQLQFLKLRTNHLNNTVIPDVCGLDNLSRMSIESNRMRITNTTLQCFQNSSTLAFVDISDNILEGPLCDIIRPLRNIVSALVMRKCNISSLHKQTFDGFNQLTFLNVADNSIQHIDEDTFLTVPRLDWLDFSGTVVSPQDRWLLNLRARYIAFRFGKIATVPLLPSSTIELILNNNNIRNITNNTFLNMDKVTSLSITQNRMNFIEGHAFFDMSSLTTLNLEYNKLSSSVIQQMFQGLSNTNLKTLSLSFNPIGQLDNTFQYFTPNSLVNLKLGNCMIGRIARNTFALLKNLEKLDLSSNKLAQLEHGVFEGLLSLKVLIIRDNQLARITGGTEIGSTLLTLDVSSNKISRLSADSLKGFDQLLKLDLGRNSLTNLQLTSKSTPNLEILILSYNRLNTIQDGALSDFYKLSQLYVDHNSIPSFYLRQEQLINMSSLESLILSANQILCFDPEILAIHFTNFTKVKVLQMKSCGLPTLLPFMFSPMRNLESLDIEGNNVDFIEPTAFKYLTKLSRLALNGNQLSSVNHKSFMYLTGLRELYIQDNPFVCTCDIMWLVETIKTASIFTGVSSLRAITCAAPEDVKGKSLESLHMSAIDCETLQPILRALAGSFGSVLVPVMMLIVWRYRWHLRYMLFLLKAGRRRYREQQDNSQYQYDAFIAHCEKDLQWVREHLLPNLDNNYTDQGFQFCIHQRDWVAGRDIADNIVTSIENSRRTIIVLSNHFAESKWCQYELAIAQLKLDADGTSRELLVIVLLEEIQAKYLSPRLRFILTSKSYIAWSDDPREQKLFWKAMRRALQKPAMVIDRYPH